MLIASPIFTLFIKSCSLPKAAQGQVGKRKAHNLKLTPVPDNCCGNYTDSVFQGKRP